MFVGNKTKRHFPQNEMFFFFSPPLSLHHYNTWAAYSLIFEEYAARDVGCLSALKVCALHVAMFNNLYSCPQLCGNLEKYINRNVLAAVFDFCNVRSITSYPLT